MKYIDGFVIVVPKKNKEAYIKMATRGKEIWMKHGALDYKECWGEDLTPSVPEGVDTKEWPKPMTFVELAKPKADEAVAFSYIVYRDKKHRDEVNAKVMSDPAMNEHASEAMPFEMNKMAYGGFEVVVGE